uniref:Peptidase A1 domain-containing protein n=1 Tax=Angiostrongylus cantonensis TaxID=6313 RepID=A0A0K0D5R7_ANGCA
MISAVFTLENILRLAGQADFYCLDEATRNSCGNSGGLFTYGAVDTMNCGPVIAYEPLTSSSHYTHTKVYEVAADTGTPPIGGPKVIIQKLAEVAGVACNATEDASKINCSVTAPTLDFTIGTNKYPINLQTALLSLV